MKEVRPTSGKVLQALFSILGDIRGAAFLDLFSGTGRVARMARDRGACPVAAVEILPARVRRIRPLFGEDLDFLLLAMDIRRSLGYLERKKRLFDIIFADPPYGEGWPPLPAASSFPGRGVLAPAGVAVVEHSSREDLPEGIIISLPTGGSTQRHGPDLPQGPGEKGEPE
ncbi:RsmD family RNA methyltransferase [Aminivibrio sp.]